MLSGDVGTGKTVVYGAVIAAALEAEADFVVSGDNDFLALGAYRDIPIVSPADFLQALQVQD